MNKFRQVIAGSTLAVTTLGSGIALEANNVEAARIEQGIYDIPSTCPNYVGAEVSIETERALRSVGFTGIDVDGKVSDVREQGSILGAQKFMKEIGVIGSSVTICGFPGAITLEGVKKMLNPGDVNESQITQAQPTTRPNILNSTVNCESIELTSWADSRIPGSDGDLKLDNGAEARALQEALNNKGFNVGNANGDVGSRTLGGFAMFQKETFGKIDCLLGSQSFTALELTATVKKTDSLTPQTALRSASFDAKADCPTRNSCEILVDLSEQKIYVKKNDRKYSTANGENLFISNGQTGGPGNETDQGHATLGRVELGPEGNPWRLSSITRAVNPQAEPNLYKFRRINPDSGRPSGEGFHGSPLYREDVGPRSAGCVRVPNATADIMSDMPTGTAITITQ
jgi:hypothetical protein